MGSYRSRASRQDVRFGRWDRLWASGPRGRVRTAVYERRISSAVRAAWGLFFAPSLRSVGAGPHTSSRFDEGAELVGSSGLFAEPSRAVAFWLSWAGKSRWVDCAKWTGCCEPQSLGCRRDGGAHRWGRCGRASAGTQFGNRGSHGDHFHFFCHNYVFGNFDLLDGHYHDHQADYHFVDHHHHDRAEDNYNSS